MQRKIHDLDWLDLLYWYDYVLAPFYIFILILITQYFIKRKYKNQPIQKYIMPALYLRIIGCILSAFLYQYYYHGGDTFGFFAGVLSIRDAFAHNFKDGLDMLWTNPEYYTPTQNVYLKEWQSEWYFKVASSYHISKIGAFLALFTFTSYLNIGLILAFFSFLGCWKLFLTFYDMYPHMHKQVAISTLFIPSVFFWGASGLMKDSVVMASLGYLTYSTYHLFIKGKFKITYILQLLISFYVIFDIKIYIIIAFMPALVVWVFLSKRAQIKNRTIKILATPLFFTLGAILGFVLFQKLQTQTKQYSTETVLKTAVITQKYLSQVTEQGGGSGYDLGEIELTLGGVLKVAPKAINVALFRPYIWEVRKPILLPSVLESLFFLVFTIYIFYKIGFIQTIKSIVTDPTVLFCLIFSLIFAFAVGFSTYNFGSLARYRIPALPFYFLALFVMYDKTKVKKNMLTLHL
jgi:hypothetical protein